MRRKGASPDRRRRRFRGRRVERRLFVWLARGLVVVVLAAWTASVVRAYRERAQGPGAAAASEPVSFREPAPKPLANLSAGLADPRTSSTAYLEDAARGSYGGPLRGKSG